MTCNRRCATAPIKRILGFDRSMHMTLPRTRSDWVQLLHRFSLLFVCIGTITIAHRFVAFDEFLDGIDFVKTYNDYRGFDPTTAGLLEYREALRNGVHADLSFALVSSLILMIAPRFIVVGFCIFLFGFYAIDLEHIQVNLTSLDLKLIGLGTDPVFLSAHFRWRIVETALAHALVFGVLWAVGSRLKTVKVLFTGVAIALILFGVRPTVTPNIAQPLWIQSHPLLLSFGNSSLAEDDREFDVAELERPFLTSAPTPPQRKNVVILYLEGLSQASIANGDMTTLQSLGQTELNFQRYFSHQLITANGLYSTLTGQMPRFSGPAWEMKWFDMADDDPEVTSALPWQFVNLGYNTTFIQSAKLSYMEKDIQLPRLGFQNLRGAESFETWYGTNGWGVDDLTLMEGVLEEIDQFPMGDPWMIAALTTGTHAPYNVPPDFLPNAESDRYRALRWADRAIEELMQGLEARDLLDDTVIIITSDESRERIVGSSLANEMALNWLPLIVVNADQQSQTNSEIITATDFPWLVLSQATGIEVSLPGASKDAVLFGNTISGRFFWYEEQNQTLLACETTNYTCGEFSGVSDLGDLSTIVPERVASFPGLRDLLEE